MSGLRRATALPQYNPTHYKGQDACRLVGTGLFGSSPLQANHRHFKYLAYFTRANLIPEM